MSKLRPTIDLLAAAAMFIAAAVAIWFFSSHMRGHGTKTQTASLPLPSEAISLEGAETRGNRDASVALLEFADFECPACQAFARDVRPWLEKEYLATGRLLFAWRHFPLALIHRDAVPAARASHCAGSQGRFWQMHDRFFESPDLIRANGPERVAADLELDEARFGHCLNSPESRQRVETDIAIGDRLKVTATPSFFVGRLQSTGLMVATETILGVPDAKVFQAAFERALRAEVGKQTR